MNIIVCIKQVPDTAEIKINPETNTLMREGVPSIINPFDLNAVEALQDCITASETAWGAGIGFEGSSWAMYFYVD